MTTIMSAEGANETMNYENKKIHPSPLVYVRRGALCTVHMRHAVQYCHVKMQIHPWKWYFCHTDPESGSKSISNGYEAYLFQA
jgi:hypothetical protein